MGSEVKHILARIYILDLESYYGAHASIYGMMLAMFNCWFKRLPARTLGILLYYSLLLFAIILIKVINVTIPS